MARFQRIVFVSAVVLLTCSGFAALAQTHSDIFFLHHSVGRNMIDESLLREFFEAYNAYFGKNYAFWDHDYNYLGLRDPDGDYLGYSYNIPGDDTDPEGLHVLWTTANSARSSILSNHEVIVFKSCYTASRIQSSSQLQSYMQYYREIRDVFDQYPGKLFVVMSPPPLHRLQTTLAEADRARAFATWMCSEEYLAGHPNIRAFNLFDQLAHPNDGSNVRNMLRYAYERSHSTGDSHPNELANSQIGIFLSNFLVQITSPLSAVGEDVLPASRILLRNVPNPFNPTTRIMYELPEAGPASLCIYDLQGRLVRKLVSDWRGTGPQQEIWNGRDDSGNPCSSGIYIYRLQAGPFQGTGKMTLAR
jgi:hypothetical protein